MSNDRADTTPLPLLFCLCAPAGSGKSTVCAQVVANDPQLRRSISTTTRQPRPGEIDGQHYFFVTKDEFEQRRAAGRFVEHAQFGQESYGTETLNVECARESRQDLMLAIDVQGVKRLKELFPRQTVTVFLFPPSFAILEQRLRSRATENEQALVERLEIARREIEILRDRTFSDYLVINDTIPFAVDSVRSIVVAERLRLDRLSDTDLDERFRS
ncbi:MAG: guanylate kinase [Bdellovibrionales bacterium]|nr:guanylate kinase [Bdellovibrionales bacterium]